MMYPLVLDLAADGIPVAVTCRVLGFSKQAFYAWTARPVSRRDLDALADGFAAAPVERIRHRPPRGRLTAAITRTSANPNRTTSPGSARLRVHYLTRRCPGEK
jgi:hypothetical protein